MFYLSHFSKVFVKAPNAAKVEKPTRKPTPTGKNKLSRSTLPGLFYRLLEDLGGVPHAFLIGVGVHAESYRLVAVAQGLRDTGDVGPIGDGNTDECVPLWHNKDKSENPMFATG